MSSPEYPQTRIQLVQETGLRISESGEVFGPSGKPLKQHTSRTSPFVFSTHPTTHKSTRFLVADLLLRAFGPKPPSDRHHATPIDGDWSNLDLNNLRWEIPTDRVASVHLKREDRPASYFTDHYLTERRAVVLPEAKLREMAHLRPNTFCFSSDDSLVYPTKPTERSYIDRFGIVYIQSVATPDFIKGPTGTRYPSSPDPADAETYLTEHDWYYSTKDLVNWAFEDDRTYPLPLSPVGWSLSDPSDLAGMVTVADAEGAVRTLPGPFLDNDPPGPSTVISWQGRDYPASTRFPVPFEVTDQLSPKLAPDPENQKGYEIDLLGRVFNVDRGHEVPAARYADGYSWVVLAGEPYRVDWLLAFALYWDGNTPRSRLHVAATTPLAGVYHPDNLSLRLTPRGAWSGLPQPPADGPLQGHPKIVSVPYGQSTRIQE